MPNWGVHIPRLCDRRVHGFCNQSRAHGRIACGQPLGQCQHIRADAFFFAGKHWAGSAKARDDFVHDQQDAQAIAGIAYSPQISLGRNNHATRALYRLTNKGSYVVSADLINLVLQCANRTCQYCRLIWSVRVTVGVRGWDMVLLGRGNIEMAMEQCQGSQSTSRR